MATDAEIAAAITAPGTTHSARVEVLDGAGIVIGELDDVRTCVVDQNIDRTIKRTCDIGFVSSASFSSLDPATDFIPFVTRFKPYTKLTWGNLSAEWAIGDFLWTQPNRVLTDAEFRHYSATLLERGPFILTSRRANSLAPIAAGTLPHIAIENVLQASQIPADLYADRGTFPSGGPPLSEMNYTGDSTFAEIINAICATSGWRSMFFAGDGTAQIKAFPSNFAAEVALWTYATDNKSILVDKMEYAPNIDRMANRVQVRATTNNPDLDGNQLELYEEVTLEDVAPGHPYSHETLGYYVDLDPVDDNEAAGTEQLKVRGENIMVAAAQTYQRIEVPTRGNPLHTAFDIVDFQYTGDDDFGAVTKFHERGWTLDLMTFEMSHTLSRVYEP